MLCTENEKENIKVKSEEKEIFLTFPDSFIKSQKLLEIELYIRDFM